MQLQARRRELTKLISENQDQPVKTAQLEAQWRQLEGQAQKAIDLQKECQGLSAKIKSLPSLVERKASYEARLAQHQAEEKEISARDANIEQVARQWKEWEQQLIEKETRLQKTIRQLQARGSWVELAGLEMAIEMRKTELEQLSKQLGEKRSLLDKLLGRKKEGG